MKYAPSNNIGPLLQGEILSNVLQVKLEGQDADIVVVPVFHPYVIVLTQDCDIEQHLNLVSQGKMGNLPNILFCETVGVETLKGGAGGSDIWKRIKQNKDERYQCIEKVASEVDATGEGIGALGIDFKRYFTVPAEDLLGRLKCGESQRRAQLVPPYSRQLAMRFFYYQMRVGLPEEHVIDLLPAQADL